MFSLLLLQFVGMTWCEIKSGSLCLSVLDLASSPCHFSLGQSLLDDRSMAVNLQLGETKYSPAFSEKIYLTLWRR